VAALVVEATAASFGTACYRCSERRILEIEDFPFDLDYQQGQIQIQKDRMKDLDPTCADAVSTFEVVMISLSKPKWLHFPHPLVLSISRSFCSQLETA
jgi:hypothetical protein